MIKKIIAGFCLLSSGIVLSQENNASPYSYYGLGDQKFKGTVENKTMGGLGTVRDSVHINLQNPATYNALAFTTFTIGANTSSTVLKTASEKENANRTTLDYLAVAIPTGKLGIAFGIMPYTSVGYRIENTETGEDDLTRYRRFEGSGGLNRVFAGAAYSITPKLSIGANFQYDFGNIETKSIVGISDLQYPTREINNSHYDGASFNIGATYKTKFKSLTWVTAANFTPSTTLSSEVERDIATITLSSSGSELVVDELEAVKYEEDIKQPSRFSIGTGIGLPSKWYLGAEYSQQSSNELGNRFDNVTGAGYENSYRMSLGGYYIPNYNSFTSYFSRITYRAGLRYENTGLVINNESIKDAGFSFGLGLPVGAYASNLNLGFEVGKRGTTNAGLVQENYFNIYVSLSFNDRWFVKRKYD